MAVESYDSLLEQLQQNADWRVGPSVEKARAFVTAATKLIVVMPTASSDDGHSTSTNIAQLKVESNEAQQFLNESGANAATSSRVRMFSFRGFRR